ncbi:MAG: hypothetical protein WAM14_22625 [Candidatus Nitrosopolaris sp.]
MQLKQAFESVDTKTWWRRFLWIDIHRDKWKQSDIETKWELFYGVSETEEETWI